MNVITLFSYKKFSPLLLGLFALASALLATGFVTPVPVFAQAAPVYGCMDSTANNYNAAATSQAGITCTYGPVTVYGCMDSTATNYNASATSQTGITCTYAPATIYGCMDSTATNYNAAATSQTGVTCTYPSTTVYGCMDSTATNYNSHATSQTGVTCTYAAATVYGCMDSTATNYNAAATSQTGVTCTYPSGSTTVYGCMDSTATNYNAAATSQAGVTCTYPAVGGGGGGSSSPVPATVYGCMDSTATNYNASATSQTGVTCTYPAASGPVGGGAGGIPAAPAWVPSGGGAGNAWGGGPMVGVGGAGGAVTPQVTLATLPHLGSQPLVYLYLSQIPYTGLDLGPVGTAFYWLALIGVSIVLAYFILFGAVPVVNRGMRDFGTRVNEALNTRAPAPAPLAVPVADTAQEPRLESAPSYSSYDGFKSYARNGALSIDDIVKGLSRQHRPVPVAPVAHVEPVYENVEPVFDHVEPIYEHLEAIREDVRIEKTAEGIAVTDTVRMVSAHVRGFASALVGGDRAAVFAGLREHTRSGGAPEHLISKTVCLVDDVYRSRIDGTVCDPDLARLTARLDTPTLEKLVASLAIAIDSSYTDSVTGAKLALTRALSVLGA